MNEHDESQAHHGLSRLHERLRRMQRGQAAPPEAPLTLTMLEGTAPIAAQQTVSLLVYPQDPLYSGPEIRTLPANEVERGLHNERVRIVDDVATAVPDQHGSYLYWPGTREFDQVNAFYYVTFTLRMLERYAGRMLPWSFADPRLKVRPNVGSRANAFYNEQTQTLGFHTYRANGATVSTAQSADIVAHETGHAVLDGIRDLWNESFGLGSRALHESVGDMVALLVALHDNDLVKHVLEWTDGNLRVSNVITELAEHLAQVDSSELDLPRQSIYLRNAINPFVDMPFDEMPAQTSDPLTTLARQEHNYSRVFTGAFWDLFAMIYERLCATEAPFIAVTRARRYVGRLLMWALDVSPVGELNFDDLARAFLTADQLLLEGQFAEELVTCFDARRVLRAADAREHLRSLRELPLIEAPDEISHMLSATSFYERHVADRFGWPGVGQMTPLSLVRNSAGWMFMTLFQMRREALIGSAFRSVEGATVDLFGGVTLAFDERRRLKSAIYRPATDEDARRMRVCVADMLTQGRVVNRFSDVGQTPTPAPQALHLPDDEASRLVRYPVLADEVAEPPRSLAYYMKVWRDRLAKRA
ncbi:hypothetical protein VZO05_03460 [Aggregatilineales bacterium SYSU G02658]